MKASNFRIKKNTLNDCNPYKNDTYGLHAKFQVSTLSGLAYNERKDRKNTGFEVFFRVKSAYFL